MDLLKDKELIYTSKNENIINDTKDLSLEEKLNSFKISCDSLEKKCEEKKSEMRKMTEIEMEATNLIKNDGNVKFFVKRAYCEHCGEELISYVPPMFNPFTFEKICKHTCSKCGKTYNLEFAYPRLVIIDNNGIEIQAYLR